MDSVAGQWHKRFAIHVGGLTLGVVRLGSHCFNLPPEPKAALEALRGAEVGLYRLEDSPSVVDPPAVFAAADKAMKRRGWERVVGVAERRELVAIYLPRNVQPSKRMACCVLVLKERELVVASARGNVAPLLELARPRLEARL